MIKLNVGQEIAIKEIVRLYKEGNEQVIEMSGPPGSGKTTIIIEVAKALGLGKKDILFMAYVGKAVCMMRYNGLNAYTIHSTIYDLVEEYEYDSNHRAVRLPNGRYKKRFKFQRKAWLPRNIKLIIFDEAGMIPDEILYDAMSFGIPIICVGDKDQLPPVIGSSKLFKRPHVVLTEIMRQAKNSPILKLARDVLDGVDIPYGKVGKGCYVVDESVLYDNRIFTQSDILICGKNKTREMFNNHVRYDILGRQSEFPVIGDKVVCRRNNMRLCVDDMPLTNGMSGVIDYIDKSSYNGRSINIDFLPDFMDECFLDLKIDLEYLFSPERDKGFYSTNGNLMEYNFAATCHSAQGSQYDSVVIYEEFLPGTDEHHRRWLYTGITRAKHNLIVIKKNKNRKRAKQLFRK